MKKYMPTIQYSVNLGAFWASYSALFAFASVFLLAQGFTNSQIGYVIAAGSTASVLLQPGIGVFADSRRKCILHKLILILSLVMIAGAGILLIPGRGFWITALLFGLLIAVMQTLTPLTYSLGMFFINKGVPINFGIARGIGSLSYAVLSTLLGVLVERFDTQMIMYAVILIYVILIVSTLTFHFKDCDEDNPQAGEAGGTRQGFLRTHKRFAVLLVGTVFLFISHNLISNYIFQIVSYHGYSEKEMGITISIAAVLEIPILFLFARINHRFASGTLYKISGFFFMLRSLLLLLAGSLAMLYMAQLAQMFGYGLYTAASVYYVNNVIEPENRVTGQAYMTLTTAAGAVIGSLSGGYLLDLISVPGMLICGTAIAAVGAVIIIFTAQKGDTQ